MFLILTGVSKKMCKTVKFVTKNALICLTIILRIKRDRSMSPRRTFDMFVHEKFTQGNFFFHAFETIELHERSEVFISVLYDLLNDNKQMPVILCGFLNMPINSTYAQAAMKIIAEFGY